MISSSEIRMSLGAPSWNILKVICKYDKCSISGWMDIITVLFLGCTRELGEFMSCSRRD